MKPFSLPTQLSALFLPTAYEVWGRLCFHRHLSVYSGCLVRGGIPFFTIFRGVSLFFRGWSPIFTGWGGGSHFLQYWTMRGRYASHWNAFLFCIVFISWDPQVGTPPWLWNLTQTSTELQKP